MLFHVSLCCSFPPNSLSGTHLSYKLQLWAVRFSCGRKTECFAVFIAGDPLGTCGWSLGVSRDHALRVCLPGDRKHLRGERWWPICVPKPLMRANMALWLRLRHSYQRGDRERSAGPLPQCSRVTVRAPVPTQVLAVPGLCTSAQPGTFYKVLRALLEIEVREASPRGRGRGCQLQHRAPNMEEQR